MPPARLFFVYGCRIQTVFIHIASIRVFLRFFRIFPCPESLTRPCHYSSPIYLFAVLILALLYWIVIPPLQINLLCLRSYWLWKLNQSIPCTWMPSDQPHQSVHLWSFSYCLQSAFYWVTAAWNSNRPNIAFCPRNWDLYFLLHFDARWFIKTNCAFVFALVLSWCSFIWSFLLTR